MSKKDSYKRKLRNPLNIGERVLVLSERLKKRTLQANYIKLRHRTKLFIIRTEYL